jgi:hypothetical protein
LHRLALADVVPPRRRQCCPAGTPAVRGRPAPQPPPEPLKPLELRTRTPQPLHLQLGMHRYPLLHARPTRPGSLLARDDHLGREARRRPPRALVARGHHGCAQPLLFVLPPLAWAPCRGLQEAGRQPPWHQRERRSPSDRLLLSPAPPQRPRALPPPGGTPGRHAGNPGGGLAEPHALPRWRLFFMGPALAAQPVASPGRCGASQTWAARDVGHGAGRTRAGRYAGP